MLLAMKGLPARKFFANRQTRLGLGGLAARNLGSIYDHQELTFN